MAIILKEKMEREMEKKAYIFINRFECCGKKLVAVIIKGKAAVIPEIEFN